MIRTLLFVLFVGVIVIGIIMLIVANKDAMMTPKKKGVITVNDKGTKKKNLVRWVEAGALFAGHRTFDQNAFELLRN